MDRQNRGAGLLQEIILDGPQAIAKNAYLQAAWEQAMQTGPEPQPVSEIEASSPADASLPATNAPTSRRHFLREGIGMTVAGAGAVALGIGGAAAVQNHLNAGIAGLSRQQIEERNQRRNKGIGVSLAGLAAVAGGMRVANHRPTPEAPETAKKEIITEESLARDLLTQLDRALANETILKDLGARMR